MKKLFLIAMMFASSLCVAQCPPTGSVVTWESTTHDYYAPGSPYNVPFPGCTGCVSYKITATPNQPLVYDFKIGNANTTTRPIMSLHSSNGLYSTITTSHGQITYDPNNGGSNAQLIDFEGGIPTLPTDWRTVTIPTNPYLDRTLTVQIGAGTAYVYEPGCSVYSTSLLWNTPFNISNMDVGVLEITMPPFDPTHIPGLHAWWKWKTGVTYASGKASTWLDQSGNGYTMSQSNSSYRPSYDAASGAFSPDGTNDSFRANCVINQHVGEVTAVIEIPSTFDPGAVFSKSTSPGTIGDDNAICLSVNGNKALQKTILVGLGNPVTSTNVLPSTTKVIVSWSYGSTGHLWINGIQCSYSQQGNGSWLGSGNNTFMTLFTQARPGGYSYSNVKVYDVTYYNHELTATERANLTAYYKYHHSIP